MTALSSYLEEALLNFLFRGASLSPPSTLYVALHTADPTEAGLTDDEITGGSYARKSITVGAGGVFDAPSGGVIDSNAVITFATPTADWGTITHISLWDAASGGNMWLFGALTDAVVVLSGDTIRFPAGSLMLGAD